MHALKRIFGYFHGFWSQEKPQDERRRLEDETSNDAPEDAPENESDEETQLLKRQEVKYQEWFRRLETGPFYPHKLFLRNVTPGISKELLMNFLEIVTGQEDIEALYCDRPGDVLVTFKTEVDFVKVKNKCQTKLLNKRQLEVWRVPVSNSILVKDLSPDTDLDHVSCYFETPRAKGGAVLEVQPVPDKQKCVVCFKDAKVVDEVLKVAHRLGGREVRVSLYVECLGPSGGRREPYIFVPPAPVELTDEDDLKIAFLRHNSEMLQKFNLYLSEVHANAAVVGNVLIVSCTLTGSVYRVDLLVENWRDNVNKQLEQCFDFIRLQRLEVQPEIWWDVRKAIRESDLNTDDLVLPNDEKYTFTVLDSSFDEGDTFARIQNIASVKHKGFESDKPKVFGAEKLKTFQLDLLLLSTFVSDTQSHYKDLKVDINLERKEVVFHGPLLMVREAQLKMYKILQSASSTVVTDVPDVHVHLLATDKARDVVNKRLRQAGLAATWECCGNVVVVYCLHQTALLQAVNLIKTSFKTECVSLDEVSSSLQTTVEWKDTEQKLLNKHCGLLKITTDHRTIVVTAFCDIMSTVKENINKFVSESSIYSAAFQLSPSRLKFVTLFWEEKLSSISEKLKGYKINITLQSDRVVVGGTRQGIDLVRKKLIFLSEQIVCTEELITRKETIRCLSTLRNNNELQGIACTCKCVWSLHPENVSVQMITTNLPAKGPRVHAVQGDITQLTVDVIVNTANELMDHAGGLAGHIAVKGDVLVSGPGNLPCKSIIHAVGPRYKGGNKGEEECLRDTVMECLKTASVLGYTSIAIPAISSGSFGYPVKEATRVIVQAVKLFFEANRDSGIRDVQLTDILIDTVQQFKKALEEICGNYNPITKQGLSGKAQSATTATVSAIQGDITRLAVDVIVNAANERMTHDDGLAGYIVRKGGNKIQEECYSILRTKGSMSPGDLLMSGPGNLPFKAIIHAVGPVYRGGTCGEEECLRGTVLKCLKAASDQGFTSIAIPAISTGVLRYPVEEATRVIVQAVGVFFDTSPKSSIKDVQLCDYSRSTVEDFKGAIQATLENRNSSSLFQWFKVSPTNTFSAEKGVDKWTRKPKALKPKPECLKLYIFTADPQRKAHVLKQLNEFVDRKLVQQEIEDFDKVSPGMLEDACKKYNVELLVWDTGATVGGMSEDVQKLKEEISNMIKKAERQQQESMIANLVQWYYFYGSTTGNKRKSFGKRENLMIEKDFQDFQTDKNNGTAKVTKENGDVFFIKFTDNMMYPKQLTAHGIKVFRKELIQGGVSTASLLPDHWDFQEKDEEVKVAALHPGCEEYRRVYNNVLKTAKELPSVLSIERVQNPELHTQYEAKKAQMYRQNKGFQSEKTLWHGTSSDVISYINRDGFNRSFCGKNATRFGLGAYFAVNSAYSMQNPFSPPDSVGKRYMYQCKVLVGYSTKGNPEMKTLPIREGKIRYDSATNDERNPAMYIIFHDSQAYPEYLITFT